MGYKYHLQLDDDTIVNSKVSYNIIQRMSTLNIKMAVPYQIWQDSPEMLAGLAELTRYWIYINGFVPTGPLYDHLTPKSLQGLTTETWDRKYHPGYFTVLDLEFWFDAKVQDYLATVLRVSNAIQLECMLFLLNTLVDNLHRCIIRLGEMLRADGKSKV